MQYWTKEKPNKTGYYWAKMDEDETCICYISTGPDWETYVTIYDEIYNMDDLRFNNVLWGNSLIPEPVGEKI